MKINRQLLPLKIHYFFFLGSMSPILPFIILVASQLGIPVSVQGTISATILLVTVLAKPIIAALADTFPDYRKVIFLITLALTVGCYSSLWFISPMKETPVLNGQLVRAMPSSKLLAEDALVVNDSAGDMDKVAQDFNSQMLLSTYDARSCYVVMAWDCVLCSQPWSCLNDNSSNVSIKKIQMIDSDQRFEIATDPSNILPSERDYYSLHNTTDTSWNVSEVGKIIPYPITSGRLYGLEGINISWDYMSQNISMKCVRADWSGEDCHSAWEYWQFWIYILLLFVGQISLAIGCSVTDAIAVDSTRDNPSKYGYQRAWGTVGWGLMGPVSGLLVDLWSGDSLMKDYTPAFLIVFILGFFDIITCATSVEVPKIGGNNINVLRDVGPLLRQVRFLIFCCFAIMNGSFDGVVARFVFLLQEEMAQGTNAMRYMKLIQGLTLFAQCSLEAPFMFVYSWFQEKLGPQRVTSLVFFLYIFRILGLSMVGFYGPIWATLLTELMLNGACYGLGYTAIVVYAAKISPPGTSTTVQSIVNICYESFGYSLSALLGGVLFDVLGGAKMFLVMGVMSVVTFILHYLSLKYLPPPEGHEIGVMEPPKDAVVSGNAEEAEAPNSNNKNNISHVGSIESVDTVTETIAITPMEEK